MRFQLKMHVVERHAISAGNACRSIGRHANTAENERHAKPAEINRTTCKTTWKCIACRSGVNRTRPTAPEDLTLHWEGPNFNIRMISFVFAKCICRASSVYVYVYICIHDFNRAVCSAFQHRVMSNDISSIYSYIIVLQFRALFSMYWLCAGHAWAC